MFKPRFSELSDRQRRHLSVTAMLVLAFMISFNFFVVRKAASYPWWHYEVSDGDQSFTAQAVGAVNGDLITFVMHPAATLHSLNGSAFRLLALFSPSHRQVISLNRVENVTQVFQIMETAVRTARILVWLTALCFFWLFFSLMFHLTRNLWLTFLMCLYVLMTPGVLIHTYVIRMEVLSLFFVLAAIGYDLKYASRPAGSWRRDFGHFVLIGGLIGMSVLSKVQTGPVILLVMLGLFLDCLFRRDKAPAVYLRYSLMVAGINLLIMPWWAVRRPDFVTPEYLETLNPNTRYTYGTAPDHFWQGALLLLAGLGVLTFVWYLLARRDRIPRALNGLSPWLMQLNHMTTGIILSVYLVFLPISLSFEMYKVNTQNMVYSLLTNIFCRSFLKNVITLKEVARQIVVLHHEQSRLLGLNLFYVAVTALVWCLVRVVMKGEGHRREYVIAGFFLGAGLFMDAISGYRIPEGPFIQSIYAIYSICLYGLGLALWLSLEFRKAYAGRWPRVLALAGRWIVIGLLSIHCLLGSYHLLTGPRADGVSRNSPVNGYMNILGLERFWTTVEGILREGAQADK